MIRRVAEVARPTGPRAATSRTIATAPSYGSIRPACRASTMSSTTARSAVAAFPTPTRSPGTPTTPSRSCPARGRCPPRSRPPRTGRVAGPELLPEVLALEQHPVEVEHHGGGRVSSHRSPPSDDREINIADVINRRVIVGQAVRRGARRPPAAPSIPGPPGSSASPTTSWPVGSATAAELADLTGVSLMTVHRDMDELARPGLLRKYRGGVSAQPPRCFESSSDLPAHARTEREGRRWPPPRCRIVEPGMSVMLDDSTTGTRAGRRC